MPKKKPKRISGLWLSSRLFIRTSIPLNREVVLTGSYLRPGKGKGILQQLNNSIHFFHCCCPPEAESNSTHTYFGRNAHCLENRRQFDRARVACGSCGGPPP